jgi:hypothetical protein
MRQPIVRHVTRATVVTLGLVLGSLSTPAFAAAPTSWEPDPDVSTLHYQLIFFGIPLAIGAVLFLLVYLPSMTKGHSTEPALAFHKDSEWFGGPRKGLDESSQESADNTGGAGARW